MRIDIRDRFGEYCIKQDQGNGLYLLLRAAIKMKDMLEVNFLNVRLLSSDFLEAAIGRLMKDFGKKHIHTHIKFTHLSESQETSIKFTIDFYFRYYRDEEYRYVIDAAFGKTIKEEPENCGKKIRKTTNNPVTIRRVQPMVI